jgi:hypothetical protein
MLIDRNPADVKRHLERRLAVAETLKFRAIYNGLRVISTGLAAIGLA